jgi:hypothetical protein
MSEWNDAIEAAAKVCEASGREDLGLPENRHHRIAEQIRGLRKPELRPQKPAVGRIVHVMIRNGAGLHLRAAIITRVGHPAVVSPIVDAAFGFVALNVFCAPEDLADVKLIEAEYSLEPGEWKENTWRWPLRV